MVRMFYSKSFKANPLLPVLVIKCQVPEVHGRREALTPTKEACAWQPLKALNAATVF